MPDQEVESSDKRDERGFTFETVVAEELATSVAQIEGDHGANDEARNEAVRVQELESVDFYIAQGYTDIALDTLSLLEQQFGPEYESWVAWLGRIRDGLLKALPRSETRKQLLHLLAESGPEAFAEKGRANQ